VSVAYDLDEAVSRADIVSCATMSQEPLLRSAAVRPGTHVDLVGAYRPDMREADSDLVRKAEVFVDTRRGALSEAGDLAIPVREGVFHPSDVRGDLSDLSSGRHPGRRSADEVTLFKSVGHALEDLVAASLVYDAMNRT
ncbi:MAG: ornithine cyclodeaminase family protein, partial [Rhodothermales bacterium]|nr:ornithine cyclodeaminase family protein [Rhodothermales bacterium]